MVIYGVITSSTRRVVHERDGNYVVILTIGLQHRWNNWITLPSSLTRFCFLTINCDQQTKGRKKVLTHTHTLSFFFGVKVYVVRLNIDVVSLKKCFQKPKSRNSLMARSKISSIFLSFKEHLKKFKAAHFISDSLSA